MRKTVLGCLLPLLCAPAIADVRSALQLSELDTRGQLLCASAMLYFDPTDRTPDPRLLTSVFNHLQTLATDVLQLGQPAPLLQPLQAMQRVFAELDGLPPDQRQRYPAMVQELLTSQWQLQQAAAEAYASEQRSLPNTAPLLLGEQSRALASFLLDYQLRRYPLPGKEQLVLPPERWQALDKSIEERFDTLLARHAEHADALGKIRSNYQFVRGQVQQATARGHGGAEFYLSRGVIDLDELAMAVGQSAH